MNTGSFAQHLTLMEELKAATQPAHRRLETAPFFSALAACQLPLESYVGQLRALAVIHSVLEQALASCADPRIGSVWNCEMRKLPLLQNDLRFFEPRTVADVKEGVDAALKAAEQLRLLPVERPLELLACVYVLEGSTLGAAVLRPLIARAFLLSGEEGLAYLHNYGTEVQARWAQFQQHMNQLSLSAEERGQIVKAAVAFFQQLDSVFRALYPFPPIPDPISSRASIRRRAGTHVQNGGGKRGVSRDSTDATGAVGAQIDEPIPGENYFPPRESQYWFPRRETMPAADRDHAILERLRAVCAYAYEYAPFYRRMWDLAGFHPSHLKSLEDFEIKVPVVQKKDLRAAQERVPPFGDYLCVHDTEIFHIHGTSGTTGRPTAFAIGRNDWRAIANAHARVMWGMGLRPGDMICIAAVFSLYMGSWGALVGAERLGAKCFPFGAGASGMSARCVQWLNMIKPTAFYGTPTYALRLAQVAAEESLDPRDFQLKIMFFSGEPGASIASVGDKIEQLYAAQVFDCGSMAEMAPWMNVAGSAQTSGMPASQAFWGDDTKGK